MKQSGDISAEVSGLVEQGALREALIAFLDQAGTTEFHKLSTAELRALDLLCRRGLPDLLEHNTLWLIHHPSRVRQTLSLLLGALQADYHRALTLDLLVWFRCLLALNAAMAGEPEHVHEELCLAGEGRSPSASPELDEAFRRQTKELQPIEGSLTAFLRPFFDAYLQLLRRAGQHGLANFVSNRIGKLVDGVARDEGRAGVVRVLFHREGVGCSRFIHVFIEPANKPQGEGGAAAERIVHAGGRRTQLDADAQEAANTAYRTVDAFLKGSGYPDGLDERVVRWEVASLYGEERYQLREYEGGSLGLPLAVAIVSAYLARPLPNDVALTGALGPGDEGRIRPVDAVTAKVHHAVEAGARVIYVPTGNSEELDAHPALRNQAAERGARIIPVDLLEEACQRLFPPEGSGALRRVLADTLLNLVQLFWEPRKTPESQPVTEAHQRHRLHVLGCSGLTAMIVLLEGWMVRATFGMAFPAGEAWTRILVAVLLVWAGMAISFALPAACLHHRKSWSWYVSIVFLALCCGGALSALWPMLPSETQINPVYFTSPQAGVTKNVFVVWVFTWGLAANTFNTVAALEYLVERRQFSTARAGLRLSFSPEGRMPLRCVAFPWQYGALVISAVAVSLIVCEWSYWGSLRPGAPGASSMVLLGGAREFVFIVTVAEVMLFLREALTDITEAVR